MKMREMGLVSLEKGEQYFNDSFYVYERDRQQFFLIFLEKGLS